MKKLKILFHTFSEDSKGLENFKRTFQGFDCYVSFIFDKKTEMQIGKIHPDIIMLEPSMIRWEWLDILIKISREYPELPVYLYSPEIEADEGFARISEDASVFLINDPDVLKEKLERISGIKGASRKKILFVDDDPMILNSYKRILRKTPWKIDFASSGKEALEILEKKQIDLVFTDIKMPEIHGVELISTIRKRYKDIPIVVCSAYEGMKDDQDLRFYDIADFLEKPIDSEVLKAKIEELLL